MQCNGLLCANRTRKISALCSYAHIEGDLLIAWEFNYWLGWVTLLEYFLFLWTVQVLSKGRLFVNPTVLFCLPDPHSWWGIINRNKPRCIAICRNLCAIGTKQYTYVPLCWLKNSFTYWYEMTCYVQSFHSTNALALKMLVTGSFRKITQMRLRTSWNKGECSTNFPNLLTYRKCFAKVRGYVAMSLPLNCTTFHTDAESIHHSRSQDRFVATRSEAPLLSRAILAVTQQGPEKLMNRRASFMTPPRRARACRPWARVDMHDTRRHTRQ